LYVGLGDVNQSGIENASFLRTPIQFLPDFFSDGEHHSDSVFAGDKKRVSVQTYNDKNRMQNT